MEWKYEHPETGVDPGAGTFHVCLEIKIGDYHKTFLIHLGFPGNS